MKCIILFNLLVLICYAAAESNIKEQISNYFSSAVVREFADLWEKSRKSFENSIAESLKQSYSSSGGAINLYMRRDLLPQDLASGYFFSDGIVSVILKHMFLRRQPLVLNPDISLSLANNVVRLESKLSKMFIDSDYKLLRNRADVIFEGSPLKNSPFAFQQVQTKGLLTIVAEDCHLIGQAVVTLTGATPHLGHHMFDVVNCKFSIEIYKQGVQSPPVIATYFSKHQREQLERLLSQAIAIEEAAKLQGAMVSLINTTALFGNKMVEYRAAQKKIFKECEYYMQLVVRQLNKASIRQNQGVVGVPDLTLMWDDNTGEDETANPASIQVLDATVNGLDNAYPSLRGGPIKMASTLIVDEIRFYRLQVRGKIGYETNKAKGVYDFSAELHDIPVSVQIDIGGDGQKKLHKFTVGRWRNIVIDIDTRIKSVESAFELFIGYLLTEVPKTIVKHIEHQLVEAIKEVNRVDENNETQGLKLMPLISAYDYMFYNNY